MKKILALILALAMCFSLVACGGEEKKDDSANKPAASQGGSAATDKTDDKKDDKADAEVETIKIGALYPMSGASANAGQSVKWVFDYIIDKVNNEYGGIQALGGAKLELIMGDTKGDTQTALNEFERLVSVENVNVLIGLYNTAVANGVSQYCIANKVPCQACNAVGNDAYSVENEYVYHANGANDVLTYYNLEREEWKKQYMPGKKIAIVYDSADYGREQYETRLATMEETGIEEIVGIPIEAGSADFSSQILKLKNDPEIEWVEPTMSMNDAILFVRQMKEYEVSLPIFAGGGGFLQADFIEQVGDAGDYVFSGSMYFESLYKAGWDPELGKQISDQFKSEVGWAFDEAASCAWLGMWCLWDALERAESSSRDDIAKAMSETDISGEHMATLLSTSKTVKYEDREGATGVMLYNQNFDAPNAWAMIKDGEYKVVHPVEFDTEGVWQWPIPSWDER